MSVCASRLLAGPDGELHKPNLSSVASDNFQPYYIIIIGCDATGYDNNILGYKNNDCYDWQQIFHSSP